MRIIVFAITVAAVIAVFSSSESVLNGGATYDSWSPPIASKTLMAR